MAAAWEARRNGDLRRLLTGTGPHAGGTEELTPVRRAWLSAVSPAMLAIALLAVPKSAVAVGRGGWGEQLLDLRNIRLIESEDFR
jgi:hypothetical protein